MTSNLGFKGSMFSQLTGSACIGELVHCTAIQIVVRALLPLLAALLLGALALNFGIWHHRQNISGPFTNIDDKSPMLYAPVGLPWPTSVFIGPVADTVAAPRQSDLVLSLNGLPWGPPHTLHSEISGGTNRGYSHWGEVVYFTLPHGIGNDSSLTLIADYSVRVRPLAYRLLGIGFVITVLLRFCHLVRQRTLLPRHPFFRFLGFIGDNLPNCIRLLIGLAMVYAISIAYGIAAEFALPTAAFSFMLPHPDSIIEVEECWPFIVLGLAATGAALDWLAWYKLIDRQRILHNRHATHRLLSRWGLPLTVLAYVFGLSDGGWSGHVGRLDLNYMSLAGLMPYSDAQAYVFAVLDQVRIGLWNATASGRPLAAAFRQLIVALSGFSYVGTLLVQTVLIACLAFVVARKVAAWRGIWAALAFSALTYNVARPFLATALTEPLALMWALASTACLIDAMRRHVLTYALLGLVTMSLAMSIRMGSILSIPALIIWIAFGFRATAFERAMLLVVASGLAGAIWALTKVASTLYGAQASIGGDFAYVACGLTIGADWTACPRIFASQLAQLSHDERIQYMYFTAWQNFIGDPLTTFRAMFANVYILFVDVCVFMLYGYARLVHGSVLNGYLLQWLLVPGIVISLSKQRAAGELWFWLLLIISTLASAAIIFHDDGWRTLHVTWAFAALIASLGFVTPLRTAVASDTGVLASARSVGVSVTLSILLVFAAPWITDRWKRPEMIQLASTTTGGDGALITGMMMAGFVVIPDGEDRPRTVPTLHLSDFIRLIRDTRIPLDQNGFLDRLSSLAPFGFVVGAQASGGHSDMLRFYVTPPQIVGAVARGWLFDIKARPVYGRYATVLCVDKVNAVH